MCKTDTRRAGKVLNIFFSLKKKKKLLKKLSFPEATSSGNNVNVSITLIVLYQI